MSRSQGSPEVVVGSKEILELGVDSAQEESDAEPTPGNPII